MISLAYATCLIVATTLSSATSFQPGQKQTAEDVFKKASPAIVTVSTSDSTGTGFFVASGKLLVTAAHVVEDTGAISLSSPGIQVQDLLYMDKASDLAIYSVSKPSTSSLVLRASSQNVGAKVYAIGTSLGFLTLSMSEGIVSGLRVVNGINRVQFTAQISEGNSGCPLLDSSGQVVGIVTSRFTAGNDLNIATSAVHLKSAITVATSRASISASSGPKAWQKIPPAPSDRATVSQPMQKAMQSLENDAKALVGVQNLVIGSFSSSRDEKLNSTIESKLKEAVLVSIEQRKPQGLTYRILDTDTNNSVNDFLRNRTTLDNFGLLLISLNYSLESGDSALNIFKYELNISLYRDAYLFPGFVQNFVKVFEDSHLIFVDDESELISRLPNEFKTASKKFLDSLTEALKVKIPKGNS